MQGSLRLSLKASWKLLALFTHPNSIAFYRFYGTILELGPGGSFGVKISSSCDSVHEKIPREYNMLCSGT